MKWIDCTGTYEAYLGLGSTCQTAYQLRRLNLRKFSGPLDWFISRRITDLTCLIRKRYTGFMELNRLELLGINSNHYIVRDNSYDVVSYHDFPLIYQWTEAYPAFKQKIDRRVDAFLSATKKSPLCLVRTETSKKEAQQLFAALKSIIPGKFRLLIVNNKDVCQEVQHEDWGLPNISSVSIPMGEDWKGSNPAWDQVMDGFKLKSRVQT